MKIAYNVKELTKVAEELRAAYEVRKYCLDYEENHPGDTLKMKPRCCSRWFFWLCCCDEKVSIIEEVEFLQTVLLNIYRLMSSSTTTRRS